MAGLKSVHSFEVLIQSFHIDFQRKNWIQSINLPTLHGSSVCPILTNTQHPFLNFFFFFCEFHACHEHCWQCTHISLNKVWVPLILIRNQRSNCIKTRSVLFTGKVPSAGLKLAQRSNQMSRSPTEHTQSTTLLGQMAISQRYPCFSLQDPLSPEKGACSSYYS